MNDNIREILSFRVDQETKSKLEKIAAGKEISKTELYEKIINDFLEQFKDEADTSSLNDDKPKNEGTMINETEQQNGFEKIVLELNPVQAFALKETVLFNDFITSTNKTVDKINSGNDNSLFVPDVYSGVFNGVFNHLKEGAEDQETISQNMGSALINLFMATIIFGSVELDTNITKRMIKDFLNSDIV